jgi:protein Mpv17
MLAATLVRVALDQIVFAPAAIGVFLAFSGTVDHINNPPTPDTPVHRAGLGDSIKARLDKDYAKVLIKNYSIWPWVQLANFYFVPLHLRMTFVNAVAIGWNAYLCSMAAEE